MVILSLYFEIFFLLSQLFSTKNIQALFFM